MTTILLVNPTQAHSAMQKVWEHVKAMTMAGHRLTLKVEQERRTSAENKLLHALIGEIASSVEWAGQKRDSETWKRLLVAAWCRTRGESVEILPALDGHGVDIVPQRTSKLNKAECADLISFVEAWHAEHQ